MFKWFLGLLAIFVGWCLDWGIDHKIRRTKTWWHLYWYSLRSRTARRIKHWRRRSRNRIRDSRQWARSRSRNSMLWTITYVATIVTLHYLRPKLWRRFLMDWRSPWMRDELRQQLGR